MNSLQKGLAELVADTVKQNQPDLENNILTKDDAKKLIKRYASQEYFNATEAANYLGVSRATFLKYRQRHRIKSLEIDGIRRWKRSDLDEFIERYAVQGYA